MIILYGGTFNPPTIAHYEIAKYLIHKYQPEKLIFIPVGSYYNKPHVVDFIHRFNMLSILTERLPGAEVTDFENGEYHGTLVTLDHFQSLYPLSEIYFVLGADNLVSLDQWINIQLMVKKYQFIVLNRQGYDVEQFINQHLLFKNYSNRFKIENELPTIHMSSTEYRDHFKDEFVIKEINDYIYMHRLYSRGGKNEK